MHDGAVGGSAKPLSQKALRQLVSDLAGKIDRLEQEVERLRLDNSNLRLDNQALKDEIARLKNLPPRPPFKPSGMEKATQPRPAGPGRRPGRGAKRDRVTREVTLRVEVPPGSRFKGYKTVVRRDLVLVAEVVRYKRERWVTPEGQTIIAPLPVGIAGGFGPGVRRFCLALHTQGQVTTERLTDLLNGIGLSISKREVVRLLTTGSGAVRAGRPRDPDGRCQLTSWNEKIGLLVGLDINSETNGRSIVSLLVPVPSGVLSGIASSTLLIGSQRCAAIVSKEMSKAPHILNLNAHSQIRCSKLNA